MKFNPRNVLRILQSMYPSDVETPVKEIEKEVAVQISGIIKDQMNSNVIFEHDEELIFENELYSILDSNEESDQLTEEYLENLVSSESQSVEIDSGSWHGSPADHKVTRRPDIIFSKRKAAVEYWRGSKKKRRAISCVQSRYRFVDNIQQLKQWEKQIEKDGPIYEKFRTLTKNVISRFMQARNERHSVHDIDLQRWAIFESKQLSLSNFKASNYWLFTFKKLNRITSRRISKFICRGTLENHENLIAAASDFVNSVSQEIESFGRENVYNTDQSGFNLELHGARTLENVGATCVQAVAQSVASTTHSYTIMPTVSAAGCLLSPLVIVFKEPNGKFGPVVKQNLPQRKNILPIASKSSMMGKIEITRWFNEAFLLNVQQKSLLLVDSLKAYNCVKEDVSRKHSVELRIIPPHTTGLIQPLDVYFFRIWKSFVRKISELILLENLNFQLRLRNNIIILQSLIHNQLSAPRFYEFRQYAWFKAQYFKERPPEFVHPVSYCFMSDDLFCSKCPSMKLIKCAWCEESLCLQHSLLEDHFHD